MKKKDAVLKLWRECFNDSDQYVDMFFSKVYRDDDALLLEEDDRPVSSMLLQRYAMNFHGVTISVSYICGAATDPRSRCRGCMTELMREGLRRSFDRGDMLSTLIPASEHLYHYYGHFCFSPVFYVDLERYTSAHTFRHEGEYTMYTALDSEEAYSFFRTMMEQRDCTIQHTEEQYRQILMDNSADAGIVSAIADCCGNPAAMAFTVPVDGEAIVKDVLAVDDDARNAVLEEVHREFSDMPITVYAYYKPTEGELQPRGMARIVNAEECLSVISAAYPKMNLALRVSDPVIDENNGTFVISGGECRKDDSYDGKLDYDIDIEVLTSIIFGNDVTRNLLDFPAVRPFISLMLD